MREYLREGRDLVKMRWWCIRKHEQDWSGDKIAAHLGIPRSTAYYWIDTYADSSLRPDLRSFISLGQRTHTPIRRSTPPTMILRLRDPQSNTRGQSRSLITEMLLPLFMSGTPRHASIQYIVTSSPPVIARISALDLFCDDSMSFSAMAWQACL